MNLHRPFVACLGQRLDRSVGRERDLPFVGLDEVVQLDEVDLIDAQPGQATLPARPRAAGPVRSPVFVARNTL